MNELQGTHNLANMIFTVNGRRITGFGETDAITVTYDGQRAGKRSTADGQVGKSVYNDAKMGTITLTIAQTNHEAARIMDDVYAQTEDGSTVPLALTDEDSGRTITVAQAWPQNENEESWNKDETDQVHTFDCVSIVKGRN